MVRHFISTIVCGGGGIEPRASHIQANAKLPILPLSILPLVGCPVTSLGQYLLVPVICIELNESCNYVATVIPRSKILFAFSDIMHLCVLMSNL